MRALRRQWLLLLAAAALLFTANPGLSLPSLDDCFYARKGVEMARSGDLSTVTWNAHPTFQNPPLQIAILAASFSVFGENDFAARLPSALMALGTLCGVFWLGRRLAGEEVAGTAAALLAIAPFFCNHARRCMLDVALTFWVVVAFVLLTEGERRPRLLGFFAIPLGAALLTKSVLGLLPLLVLASACVFDSGARRLVKQPWLLVGVLGGLGIGLTWPLHQYLVHGVFALREHYVGEIASRTSAGFSLARVLTGYPMALLGSFQPVVLPALAGIPLLWRTRGLAERLLVAWILAPIALYSFSSAQSPRYLFPTLPAMALVAALWSSHALPRFTPWLRRAAPGVLALAAVAFWTKPDLLAHPGNDPLKRAAGALRDAAPAGQAIPYLGTRYWGVANPLLYYAERPLDATQYDAAGALAQADSNSGLLLVDKDRRGEIEVLARFQTVIEWGDAVLLRLAR